MTPDQIEALFTRSDGTYAFARWGRPVAPVVFGVDEGTLPILKGALEALAALAGHAISETDPELGANLMVFFVRDWDELTEVPQLDRLVTGLAELLPKLKQAGANQYRVFRFEPDGAIRACIVLLRMDDELASVSAETLALGQMVQSILLWSDTAFRDTAPLLRAEDGTTILSPDIAGVIRAGYDPVMPRASSDPSHALRLAARLERVR